MSGDRDDGGWIDVLLEEELGGAGPRREAREMLAAGEDGRVRALARCALAQEGGERGRPRLAASLVCALGLGTVGALWPCLAGRAGPAQDPQLERLHPRDAKELLELLAGARAIHLNFRPVPVPTIGTLGPEGLTLTQPISHLLDATATVQAWSESIRASIRAEGRTEVRIPFTPSLTLDIDVGGKRSVLLEALQGRNRNGSMAFLCAEGLGRIQGNEALAALVAEAWQKMAREAYAAAGYAREAADLCEIAIGAKSVIAPCLDESEIRLMLGRFTSLAELGLEDPRRQGQRAPHGAAIEAICSLASLSSLSLPASGLDEGDFAKLAKLAQLRELELRGPLVSATGVGIARLAGRLTVLRFAESFTIPDDVFDRLGEFQSLEDLGLCVSKLSRPIDGLLRKLPRLRRLWLHEAKWFGDAQVKVLLDTKLEDLYLAESGVSHVGLAELAKLPSLRRLDIRGIAPGVPDLDRLAPLRQVKELIVENGDLVQRLAGTLPGCEVLVIPFRSGKGK